MALRLIAASTAGDGRKLASSAATCGGGRLDNRSARRCIGASGDGDERSRARLLREAKAIAKLSHANVIVVHDTGTFRERVFIAFVVFYALGAIDLWLIHAPAIMTASMAGYAASALVVQWITRYWKISTHALGITAPLVALTVLFGQRPAPFYILIPLVGWSRIYLRAHTLLQVVAGTLLALGTTLLFFKVFHVV